MATKRVRNKKEIKQTKQIKQLRTNKRHTIRGSGATQSIISRDPLSSLNKRIKLSSEMYDYDGNTLTLPSGIKAGDIVIGFHSKNPENYWDDFPLFAGVLKIAKYNYNTGEAISIWQRRDNNNIIYPVEPRATYTGPVVQIEELFRNNKNDRSKERTVNYYVVFTPIIEFLDTEICKLPRTKRAGLAGNYFKANTKSIIHNHENCYRRNITHVNNFYAKVYKHYSKVFNNQDLCPSNSDEFTGVIFEEGS